jgi:DNA-binding transcriptional LysR family regulator
LRITAPAAFGRLYISPHLEEFREVYPDISIGLSLSDQFENIIGRGFDVAIRLGQLEDSSLVARKIGQSRSVLCASPGYLQRNGCPKNPGDLKAHNCLQFRSFPGQNRWKLIQGGKHEEITVSGSLFANSGEALLSAVVNHLGIAYLPRWLVKQALETEALMLVLPEWKLVDSLTSVQAVIGHRQHVPSKVEAFVRFLSTKLSSSAWD